VKAANISAGRNHVMSWLKSGSEERYNYRPGSSRYFKSKYWI